MNSFSSRLATRRTISRIFAYIGTRTSKISFGFACNSRAKARFLL